MSSQLRFLEMNPSAEQYCMLRQSAGWLKLSDYKAIENSLDKSLYSICVYEEDKLIGFGRIVGDTNIYFYIQDLVILPEYQKQGIGNDIVKKLLKYIDQHAIKNAFIGLMAAENVAPFYEKLGFKKRAHNEPGMEKRIFFKTKSSYSCPKDTRT